MTHFPLSMAVALIAFGTTAGRAQAAPAVTTRAAFVEHVVQTVFPRDAQTYDCLASLPAMPHTTYTRLFADVRTTDAHAVALCIGIHNGIIDGDRTASFRPNDPINVAEASKILALAYGVALPDSVDIRVLPWHWRYTEAFKRRGILPRDFEQYGSDLTKTHMDQMFQRLSAAQPRLLPVSQGREAPVTGNRASSADRGRRTDVRANGRTVGNYHMRLLKSFSQREPSPRPGS